MTAPAPPRIFDRNRVRLHRDRAARRFAEYSFLKSRVTEQLVERLADVNRTFETALDLGTHDGALARALTGSGRVVSVVATDISTGMIAQADGARVMDEEVFDIEPASLDLVVSAFSLHWVNDLPGTLIQIRRALKPDGLLLAALPGGETLRELRSVLVQAESELTGGASPRVSPFLDGIDAGRLLQRTGFTMPVSDTDRLTVRYRSLEQLLSDLRGMGESAAFAGPVRPLQKDVIRRAAELYAEQFSDPDCRLRATFDIVWLSGWAPAPHQPKPKAPGSARVSLAKAVGSVEHATGDAVLVPKAQEPDD